MSTRGVTLAELAVTLALTALVGTAVVRLVSGAHRLHRDMASRITAQSELRTAAMLLQERLGGVTAGAAPAGDLETVAPDRIRFRVTEGHYRTCRPTMSDTVVILAPRLAGDAIRPEEHAVVVYDPAAGAWRVATPRTVAAGPVCQGGAPGLRLLLAPPGVGVGLPEGSPLRALRRWEVRLYQAAAGDWWIGAREYVPGTGRWATTQPVAGPVAAGGLQFVFRNGAGAEVSDPAAVRLVHVLLRLPGRAGSHSLATTVHLRPGP